MAEQRDAPRGEDDSVPALVRELARMVVTYAKEQTIEPAKDLGRFVAFGLVGSFALALGLVLLALGGLRALQTETGSTMTGHLSWAPYAITAAVLALLAGLSARAIGRGRATERS